jgi:putative sigma-54 modulation protein
MKLQVHSIHFDADQKLIGFIQKKVDKVPGNQLFAKEQARSFEEATDLATEALRIQLNKFKTKMRSVRV